MPPSTAFVALALCALTLGLIWHRFRDLAKVVKTPALLLRQAIGVGTPRSLRGGAVSAVCGLIGRFAGLWSGLERLLMRFRPHSVRVAALSSHRPLQPAV